jgi:hypothetical protein
VRTALQILGLGILPAGDTAGQSLRRWAEVPNRRELIVKVET